MKYIEVKCQKCGNLHKIESAEFDYEEVEVDEREMGEEITYEATVERICDCEQTIEITHTYWEYPEGIFNDHDIDVVGADIINNKL